MGFTTPISLGFYGRYNYTFHGVFICTPTFTYHVHGGTTIWSIPWLAWLIGMVKDVENIIVLSILVETTLKGIFFGAASE